MTAWLVKVMVAVLTDERVQAMLSKLIRAAVDQANADVLAELGKLEQSFVANLEQLPEELLGDANTTIKQLLDPMGFAKAIVAQMTGQGGSKPPWWPF